MPKADTDSTVMPNKEGGYAPNYTPLAATDGSGDFIVDCDVIAGPNEQNEMLPSADRIEENFGKKVENLSADKAFGTGANLAGMEARQVSFHTPVDSPAPSKATRPNVTTRGSLCRKRNGLSCRGTTSRSWTSPALYITPRLTVTIVRWGTWWSLSRPNAKRGEKRGTSIVAATARDAR